MQTNDHDSDNRHQNHGHQDSVAGQDEETDRSATPPRRDRKGLLIWFSFCLALVLLVAFNMK